MDDMCFLAFSDDFKKNVKNVKKNEDLPQKLKKVYLEGCNKIVRENMEQLEKCISHETRLLVPGEPYDVSFVCSGFRKMPNPPPNLDQGYGNIAKIDDKELNFYKDMNFIDIPLNEIGVLNSYWTMSPKDRNAMNEKVYANLHGTIRDYLIPKNRYAVLDRKKNNVAHDAYDVLIRLSNTSDSSEPSNLSNLSK